MADYYVKDQKIYYEGYDHKNGKFINYDDEVKNIDEFLIVYLIADVKEAMGANILNTMLEAIKIPLENITNGKSLSNQF